MNPKIYDKLMEYFLGNTQFNFFDEMGTMFFFNNLEGDCASEENAKAFADGEYETLSDEVKAQRYKYMTEFALNCRERFKREYCCFNIPLSYSEIETYFSSDYFNDQLFAIMFGRWLKLPMKQIHRLEKKRNSKHLYQLLKYFICLSEGQQNVTEDDCVYQGAYYVVVEHDSAPDEYIKAHYIGNRRIQVDSTGEVFFLSPFFP